MCDTNTIEPWRSTAGSVASPKEVRDALRKATDDEILEEVERRGLEAEIVGDEEDDIYAHVVDTNRNAVLDALIMLKTGRIDDGIAALEREFFPKWADESECRRQYSMAMGLEEARRAAA